MFKIKSKASKFSLFISVLLLIFVFYALSIKPSGRMPWHQQIVVSALSPFQKSASFIGDGVQNIWRHYFDLVGASRENDLLRKKVSEYRLSLMKLAELKNENERLRELLHFKKLNDLKSVVGAKVIANDLRGDFRSITINRGANDGVTPNMVVLSSRGLVGRVVDVAGNQCRVLLITDPNSAVDVTVQRSRARALLVGKETATNLTQTYFLSRLEYLNRQSDIIDKDIVVTSGLDNIYPSGIPVGEIEQIMSSSLGVFKDANVVPFTDFSNLEEVLLVSK